MNRIFTQRNALPIVVALLLTAPGLAAARDSGLQLTPDGKQTLISKDVGDERWVIVRAEDETVSGNVFLQDGGAPLFVWCEPREGSGDDPVELACYGADACPAAPCEEGAWAFIADVDLPASFFAPPVSPEPTPTGTPTPGPTPSSTPTSSSTPTGTSSPGADDDVRCCVADDDGPKCEDRTPAECAARGGVDLGAGSCDPNPCS